MLKKILLISFIVLTFSRVLVAHEKNFENKSDFIHQLTNDESFVWRVNPAEKVVALTFDDGPDPRFTPKVLHILSKFNIKATFFVVGENIQMYPDLLKKEFSDGHEIGNHTYTHPDFTIISYEDALAQIKADDAIIKEYTGKKPTFFRPPKGFLNEAIFSAAKAEKYKTALWTVTIEHKSTPTPELMAKRVLNYARNGTIILGHDGRLDREKTIQALPAIIEGYLKKGYRFVTLSELIEYKNSTQSTK